MTEQEKRENVIKLVQFLECIKENGLEEFHKMARCQPPYSYLCIDYEGIYCP